MRGPAWSFGIDAHFSGRADREAAGRPGPGEGYNLPSTLCGSAVVFGTASRKEAMAMANIELPGKAMAMSNEFTCLFGWVKVSVRVVVYNSLGA